MKAVYLPSITGSSFLFAGLVAMAMSVGGCKKEDNGSNNNPSSAEVLPKPGTYTYRQASSDGSVENITQTVLNARDSANGKAVTIRSVVDTSTMETVVFADASFTTYAINPPASFHTAMYELQSLPGVVDFDYGGWPVYQRMTNNPAVNDPLTFSGGPIFIHASIDSEGELLSTDFNLAFMNGKAVRTNESVSTSAGTFNCTVWAYESKSSFTTGFNGQTSEETQNYKDSMWYAPGIGMVKSMEVSESGSNETILTKID